MALDSITSASLWSSAEVILSCALNTDFTSHWDGINWSAVIKLIVEAKTNCKTGYINFMGFLYLAP